MLRLDTVTKIYEHRRSPVVALDKINLHVPRQDFVAIVGPSGSGKSTLLVALGAMQSPTSGKVFVDGKSVYELTLQQRARFRREKIGFVFQTFNLIPYLTALQNVQIPLMLAGAEETVQLDKATAILQRLGLGNRLDHKPTELSVGQMQRVALARMLANDPAVILADEPTGNLDPATCEEIMDYLVQFNNEGRTIVMVTHDPKAAKRAKRIVKLAEGRVIAD